MEKVIFHRFLRGGYCALRGKLRQSNAFTLIEVLTVVAIIAILVFISIPMIGERLERVRMTADAANERNAIDALRIMVMEEGLTREDLFKVQTAEATFNKNDGSTITISKFGNYLYYDAAKGKWERMVLRLADPDKPYRDSGPGPVQNEAKATIPPEAKGYGQCKCHKDGFLTIDKAGSWDADGNSICLTWRVRGGREADSEHSHGGTVEGQFSCYKGVTEGNYDKWKSDRSSGKGKYNQAYNLWK